MKRLFALLLLILPSCGGSIIGNPGKPRVALQIEPNTSAQVSNLALCASSIVVRSSSGGTSTGTLASSSIHVSSSSSAVIGEVSLDEGDYDQVEIATSPGCAASGSVKFQNGNGTFDSPDSINLKFVGSFQITGRSQAVPLTLQPVIDQLAAVSLVGQVKPVAEGTNGQIGPVQADVPTFVQKQEAFAINNSNSVSTGAFASAVSSGNIILCAVLFNGNTSVNSVTDTRGNDYWRIAPYGGAGGALSGWVLETWWTPSNVTSGGTGFNVTAHFASTFNGEKDISCHEYSKVAATDNVLLDQVVTDRGTSSNASTPSKLAAISNGLVWGVAAFETSGAAGSGYTSRSVFRKLVIEDKLIAAPGYYDAKFVNPAMNWLNSMAFIRGN